MVIVQLLSLAALSDLVAATEASKAAFPASHTPLSREEALDYKWQFKLLDRDSNGKITADELAKALSSPREQGDEETPPETAEPVAPQQAATDTEMIAPPAPTVAAAESSRPAGLVDEDVAEPQLIQSPQGAMQQEFFKQDLAFVHVPMNFGHNIERVALEGNREQETPFILVPSFNAKTVEDQWQHINEVRGTGGQVWGQMNPQLRQVSNYSGCNLVYEPPKHWPAEIASAYFGRGRAFGLVRDPYDRLVSEFKHQASGGGGQLTDYKRSDVSQREGSTEREGPAYQALYSNCDVNGWVKEELKHYKVGDEFRGNCHLLPQAEYFEHPHGISLPVDTRTLPDSFNFEMERHGYTIRMRASSIKPTLSCSKLSVWDLDAESKQLIQEVYAADFDLVCRHFGYCDREELTCLAQVPFMCGAAASMKT